MHQSVPDPASLPQPVLFCFPAPHTYPESALPVSAQERPPAAWTPDSGYTPALSAGYPSERRRLPLNDDPFLTDRYFLRLRSGGFQPLQKFFSVDFQRIAPDIQRSDLIHGRQHRPRLFPPPFSAPSPDQPFRLIIGKRIMQYGIFFFRGNCYFIFSPQITSEDGINKTRIPFMGHFFPSFTVSLTAAESGTESRK